MPPPLIAKLTLRGQAAGRKLATFNWNGHRWTRYLVAMSQFQLRLGGMQTAYKDEFRDFLEAYDPQQEPYVRTEAWKESSIRQTDSLMDVAGDWADGGHNFTKNDPSPEPELRIGPKR